jgi:hypothetical protein
MVQGQSLLPALRQTLQHFAQEHREAQFKALFRKLSASGGYYVIVLNAYGHLESERLTEAQLEEIHQHIAPSTKSYWIITIVRPKDVLSAENVSELREAIEARQYFYEEREKMYGISAVPRER